MQVGVVTLLASLLTSEVKSSSWHRSPIHSLFFSVRFDEQRRQKETPKENNKMGLN